MKEQLIEKLKERGASEELIKLADSCLDFVSKNFNTLPEFSTMNNEHQIRWTSPEGDCLFDIMGVGKSECPMKRHNKDFIMGMQEEKDGGTMRVVRFKGNHCLIEPRTVLFPTEEDLDAMLNWFRMEEF